MARCPRDSDNEEFDMWYNCNECGFAGFGDFCNHPEVHLYLYQQEVKPAVKEPTEAQLNYIKAISQTLDLIEPFTGTTKQEAHVWLNRYVPVYNEYCREVTEINKSNFYTNWEHYID